MNRDSNANFPGCLMALPTQFGPGTSPERARSMNAWVQSHNRAVMAFHKESVGAMADLKRSERGILSLLAGLDAIAGSWADVREPHATAHVWGPLIDGATDALNYDLGRLDGGILSSFLFDLSRRVDRDPDTGEYIGGA
jgi:hypothetical protein